MPSKLNTEPKIYVACLAAYNSGHLHGRWIDMLQPLDKVREEIQAMLKASPVIAATDRVAALLDGVPEPTAEEYAIHDFEGFGELKVSEYSDLEALHGLAELADERGEIVFSLAAHIGETDAKLLSATLDDTYQGEFKSLEDWAYQQAEDCGTLESVPEHFRNYIDFEAIGRDAELNGDVFTIDAGNGNVHVLYSH
jgi:antirestriction protein